MMNMKALYEQLFDASARIEQVICIAGAISAEYAISDPLHDLLDDGDRLLECFDDLPDSLEESLGDSSAGDEFAEWALDSGHLGFLVQIATPIMEHDGDDVVAYTWGCYRTRWVYGETFDAAVTAGLAWVAEQREREKRGAGVTAE